MIFRKYYKYTDANGEKHWNFQGGEGVQMVEQEEDEHRFICDVSFGSVSKYIKCTSLQEVVVDNSFGQVAVYFDEAVLDGGRANVSVDNSFGSVKLYVPSNWEVVIKADESFGHVRTFKNEGIMVAPMDEENRLYVNADTSFGDVEIHYI